jgi:molybdopterin adenylyltransferase
VISFAVITISDRSYQGVREDKTGPALIHLIQNNAWKVEKVIIIPDEFAIIKETLENISDNESIDVVLTTGGTGFSPRDITPEATYAVIDRLAPGLAEAMRINGLKITPHAMLSRAIAGIRGKTLIINLPGSPKAALENFETIIPVLPHAIDILANKPGGETGHQI